MVLQGSHIQFKLAENHIAPLQALDMVKVSANASRKGGMHYDAKSADLLG